MLITRTIKDQSGFALPTILISSIIMLMVLLSAVGAGSNVRTGLNTQYYTQLAREAAESGIARAKDCLESNSFVPQWVGNKLHANTDCSGGTACTGSPNCYVVSNSSYRTSFSVDTPTDYTVSQKVKVTGKIEVLRSSDGSVWNSYEQDLNARVSNDLSFNNMAFSYTAFCTVGCTIPNSTPGEMFITIGADGITRTVGSNTFGQLGNGTPNSSATPTEFILPSGVKAASVASNFTSTGYTTFVITTTGDVYGAGRNTEGQLGMGPGQFTNQTTPQKFQLGGRVAVEVVNNGRNTFVRTDTGDIFAAGWCYTGALGTNAPVPGCSNSSVPTRVNLPTYDPADPNTQPLRIVTDGDNAFVIMVGGRVYGWGQNNFGQFGTMRVAPPNGTGSPVQISTFGDPGEPKAVDMAFDGLTSWIVDSNGDVWASGYGVDGQLGDGTFRDPAANHRDSFEKADRTYTGNAIRVMADQQFATILTSTGEVWGVGLNDYGQLGNGTVNNASRFVKFNLPFGVVATWMYNVSNGMYAPNNNTYVVGNDGVVYGAGRNNYGQLGYNGTVTDHEASPLPMSLPVGAHASKVMSGSGTTVVFTTNNKVFTVGNNSDGQLGDGTTTDRATPAASRYTNFLPISLF